MSSFHLLVLLTLCGAAVAKDCIVDNFQFKQDFDMSKFPKLLFFQMEFPSSPNRDGVAFTTRLRDDAVSFRKIFRSSSTGECKEYNFEVVNELGTPKLNLSITLSGKHHSWTFYVADTDYQNYWMIYRCSEVNSNGTCKIGTLIYASVDSENPRRQDATKAKILAEKYCLDKTKFVEMRTAKGLCPAAKELGA